jgi:hypothetical protein
MRVRLTLISGKRRIDFLMTPPAARKGAALPRFAFWFEYLRCGALLLVFPRNSNVLLGFDRNYLCGSHAIVTEKVDFLTIELFQVCFIFYATVDDWQLTLRASKQQDVDI